MRKIMGSGTREKKCRWSLSRLFGEGLYTGTVAGRDVAGSHCVPQSSYCSRMSTGLCPAQMDAELQLENRHGSGMSAFLFSSGHHLLSHFSSQLALADHPLPTNHDEMT